MRRLQLIILLLCFKEAAFQILCNKHENCSACILDEGSCVWCALKDIDGSRCMPEGTVTSESCPGHIQNPKGTTTPLKDSAAKEFHIEPQIYNITLRPGQPQSFSFTYKSTKNYPVDVYFVIDASKSMKEIQNKTIEQSEFIYRELKNKSNDVKLGLGTFVDKNALPYVWEINSKKTYSFKHHLSLTEDYGNFKKQLTYDFGGNLDIPEGGLEAVCQAIACKDVIGWRKTSAKIIVYLSDGQFHAAGDGKMGGIFTPYDGKCYTVGNVYSKELEMDYPSIGMVNKLAIENEIIILFAVPYTKNTVNEYKSLSKAISGSRLTFVDSNSEDPVLMKTLTAIYENITSVIKLRTNMRSGRSKNFDITFDPDCSKDINKEACKIKPNIDAEYEFKATITLKKYQEIDNYGIDIGVEGFSDKLFLDVKVIKECDCESKTVFHSKECSDETFECGICKCGQGKYGEKCQCLANSYAAENNSTCINKRENVECSGHGHCDCGLCKCNNGFEGRYCECIKNSCDLSNGFSCGGEGRGKCECGTCKCEDDYMGRACQCYKYDAACRTDNNKICNGRGNCECGKCKCDEIPVWDKRSEEDPYCTMKPCLSCQNLQCSYVETCVLCHLKTNASCPCDGLDVEEVSMKDMENKTDWNACPDLRVDVGCYSKFLYKYDDDKHRILTLFTEEKNCLDSYYMIGGGVLGALLLIGILTLIIWKVTTEMSYRHEYRKFVEAHKEDLAGTCENPLYETPTTTFRNPAFRKRSVNY